MQHPECSLPPVLPWGRPQALPDAPPFSRMQEECAAVDRGRDVEAGGEEEEGLAREDERPAEDGAQGRAGGQAAAPGEGDGEQLEQDLEEEEEQGDQDSSRRACSLDEAFEEELMAQLEEYEQVIQDFQAELESTRTRYSLATGRAPEMPRPGHGPPGAGPSREPRERARGVAGPGPGPAFIAGPVLAPPPSRRSLRSHPVFTTTSGLPGVAAAEGQHGERAAADGAAGAEAAAAGHDGQGGGGLARPHPRTPARQLRSPGFRPTDGEAEGRAARHSQATPPAALWPETSPLAPGHFSGTSWPLSPRARAHPRFRSYCSPEPTPR